MKLDKKFEANKESLVADFYDRLRTNYPDIKPEKVQLVGIIGSIGSGKTTLAKILAKYMPGYVVVTADSGRFLLQEKNISWGDNLRTLVRDVARKVLADGYGVLLDGNSAEEKERIQYTQLAESADAVIKYVLLIVDSEVAHNRIKNKYDDGSWHSSFERFRVNTTEKMLKNLGDRADLHEQLSNSEIDNLVSRISNNGSQGELEDQAVDLARKLLV